MPCFYKLQYSQQVTNSTSYDRFWDGRKSFASLTSQSRNLARMIWLHVAPPPTDEQPGSTRGKTPRTNITGRQLHRKKADILRLCALYVVSVKHYLRGEDGLHWDDYQDFVPSWFTRYAFSSLPGSYDATTQPNSLSASMLTTGSGLAGSQSGNIKVPKGDATKRVRPKRSKPRVNSLPVSDTTALLPGAGDRALEFFEDPDETMPLPLMFVRSIWDQLHIEFDAVF